MKSTIKLLTVICLLASASGLFAQSKSDKVFDTLKNKPGVTYFSINKSMKDAFNIDLDDENETIKGDLHEIRFLSYNPEKGSLTGKAFLTKAMNMLPASYKLMDLEDDSKKSKSTEIEPSTTGNEHDVIIYKLGNNRKASEFHVFIKSDSPTGYQFLVSFIGDLDINDADGLKDIGLHFSNK